MRVFVLSTAGVAKESERDSARGREVAVHQFVFSKWTTTYFGLYVRTLLVWSDVRVPVFFCFQPK